jgi:Uma2 family endonuclease
VPLALGPASEPEPDIAVVTGSPHDYLHAHPATALLIVDVADASLTFDRTKKASVYARAGILDYWIVNLIDQVVEVHRNPEPAAMLRTKGAMLRSTDFAPATGLRHSRVRTAPSRLTICCPERKVRPARSSSG